MKTAIYPGSFNPFHKGHYDILHRSLKVFDRVIIVQMWNPMKKDKRPSMSDLTEMVLKHCGIKDRMAVEVDRPTARIIIEKHDGLLTQAVKDFSADAIVRGLRNGHDLHYEMNLQYVNEQELGLSVPTVYFVCSQEFSHVSSSMYRELAKFDITDLD